MAANTKKAQTKTRRRTLRDEQSNESDGTYLLKIVMYVIFGSFWLKFGSPILIGGISLSGIPIGLIVGFIFASHDHFQVDRKIEYVLLIAVAIMSFYLPSGIVL